MIQMHEGDVNVSEITKEKLLEAWKRLAVVEWERQKNQKTRMERNFFWKPQ